MRCLFVQQWMSLSTLIVFPVQNNFVFLQTQFLSTVFAFCNTHNSECCLSLVLRFRKWVVHVACDISQQLSYTAIENKCRQYVFTYWLRLDTWQSNQFSASQETPPILWNPKIHCRISQYPPSVPIVDNMKHFKMLWLQKYGFKVLCLLAKWTVGQLWLGFKAVCESNKRTGKQTNKPQLIKQWPPICYPEDMRFTSLRNSDV
jgi:hypothetical protein